MLTIDAHTVIFAGDWHGDSGHAKLICQEAAALEADAIIQCGDMGYWPHIKSWGERYLRDLDRLVEKFGIPIYWVAGNHENWNVLDALPREADGTVKVGNTTHLPRGTFFKIGERLAFASGGAWSVDWQTRREGYSWWPQEVLTQEFVDSIPEQKVDIIVSHECPAGHVISYKDEISISVAQRTLSLEIRDKLNPDWWFSGHHHVRESFDIAGTRVEVLDMNGSMNRSYLAFDVDEMRKLW